VHYIFFFFFSFVYSNRYICGMGEIWSSRILTAVLTSMGATVAMLDAREVLTVADSATNGSLGAKGGAMDMSTEVLYEVSARKLERWWGLRSEALHPTDTRPGPILVITGFVAVTASGTPTTLKRSGSDFSATIFARLLKVSSASTAFTHYHRTPHCSRVCAPSLSAKLHLAVPFA
jgi:aspartokinase/homoserine dehydrogenase 1